MSKVRWKDRQTDMMKLRVIFHNFMNISGVVHIVPKKRQFFLLFLTGSQDSSISILTRLWWVQILEQQEIFFSAKCPDWP